jgi:hypothetical protein
MTVDDWTRLTLYKAKRGPLNPPMRIQSSLADIAVLICSAAKLKKRSGQEFEALDFMPWAKDEADDPMSIDSVFKKLGGKA